MTIPHALEVEQRTLPQGVGVLLVGHGTRDPQGQGEFLELASLLQQALPMNSVEPGFLELAEPNLPTAVAALAGRGVHSIVVVPCLLFTAGHAKEDIPQAVASAVKAHGLPFTMAETLGVDPLMVAASENICRSAMAALPDVPAEQSCFILAGRGSSDPQAQAALREFAAARNRSGEFRVDRVAFMAAAEPSLTMVLREVAGDMLPRRLIIQPHLLFSGRVIEQIDEVTEKWLTTCEMPPKQPEIVRLPHLGPQPLLVELLLRRLDSAAAGEFT